MKATTQPQQNQLAKIIQHPSSKGVEVVNVPRRGLAKGVISIAVARRKLRTKQVLEGNNYRDDGAKPRWEKRSDHEKTEYLAGFIIGFSGNSVSDATATIAAAAAIRTIRNANGHLRTV